jgi:hypothetical protein
MGSARATPEIPSGPLQDAIAPIFTGWLGTGLGVPVGEAIGVGRAVAVVIEEVFSSFPSQAGSNKIKRLIAVKNNQHLLNIGLSLLY